MGPLETSRRSNIISSPYRLCHYYRHRIVQYITRPFFNSTQNRVCFPKRFQIDRSFDIVWINNCYLERISEKSFFCYKFLIVSEDESRSVHTQPLVMMVHACNHKSASEIICTHTGRMVVLKIIT